MEIFVNRLFKTDLSTISQVSVDGEPECWILEDKDRELNQSMSIDEINKIKVHGKTAIPAGRYEVIMSYSNRFKRILPLLLNVPGFAGIRMHPGNFSCDTEGCLLPGTNKGNNQVLNSKKAFAVIEKKMTVALKNKKVFITIA